MFRKAKKDIRSDGPMNFESKEQYESILKKEIPEITNSLTSKIKQFRDAILKDQYTDAAEAAIELCIRFNLMADSLITHVVVSRKEAGQDIITEDGSIFDQVLQTKLALEHQEEQQKEDHSHPGMYL